MSVIGPDEFRDDLPFGEPKRSIDWKGVAERAGWTLAQVAAGLATVDLASLPTWLAVPIAVLLSVAKNVKTNIKDQ